MELRALGVSELMVSPLGLGCWQFSGGAGLVGNYWPRLNEDAVREIVKCSLDGGINWFDTAEAYGWGESERVLAAALVSLGQGNSDVIIATKWWPAFRTAGSIIGTIDERLARLGGFPISLHQVHQPFGFSSVEKEMDAMARLVERKKVRYVGVSNFSAEQMRRADGRLRQLGLRLVSNQVRYSLLHRKIEANGVLESAKELGISIIASSPLAQGVLSAKYHDMKEGIRHPSGYRRYLPDFSHLMLERTRPLISELKNVAERHGATPSQVALQWLISFHGESVVAIPGSTSPAQAKEDAASMNLLFSQDEMLEIDEASKRSLRR
jgi:aryl-alcohol dehydrogenase-like predicted oxidoreductase